MVATFLTRLFQSRHEFHVTQRRRLFYETQVPIGVKSVHICHEQSPSVLRGNISRYGLMIRVFGLEWRLIHSFGIVSRAVGACLEWAYRVAGGKVSGPESLSLSGPVSIFYGISPLTASGNRKKILPQASAVSYSKREYSVTYSIRDGPHQSRVFGICRISKTCKVT